MTTPPPKVWVVFEVTEEQAQALARYHFEGKPGVVPPIDLMALRLRRARGAAPMTDAQRLAHSTSGRWHVTGEGAVEMGGTWGA